MFTAGNSDDARAALERALEIAETLHGCVDRFRLLTALHHYYRHIGDFAQSLAIAERADAVALNLADPRMMAAANVMLGASHHLSGNLAAARVALDTFPQHSIHPDRIPGSFQLFYPEAQFITAQILWLQGFPDQALNAVNEADRVQQRGPLASCQALILGAEVFYLTGEWEASEDYTDRVIRLAGEYSLEPFKSLGMGLKGEALLRRGEADRGLYLLQGSLSSLHTERFEIYAPRLAGALAVGLAARGQLDQAMRLLNEEVAAVTCRGGAYNMPELLRLRGVLLAQAGDDESA
jgi:tetratricopeptide (TPR) repeat protein